MSSKVLALGIDKRQILSLGVAKLIKKPKELFARTIDNPCNNLDKSPLPVSMLHPLGSSLALVWPDAIKGYGEKYGDNSF